MKSYDINKKILDKLDDIAKAINPESSTIDVDSNHTRNYDNDEDYLVTASKASNAAASMTIEVQESINNEITPELLLHKMNGSGINIDIIK